MNNKAVTVILKKLAFLLEIKGENPFKSRAYSNAARIIEEEGINIIQAVKEETIGDIKGFGKALREKITEFVETGRMSYYEKITAEIPESILEIRKIPGLGPRKVKMLYDTLNITGLDSLEEACSDGSIKQIKGFGDKTIEDILTGIAFIRAHKGRFLQEKVRSLAESTADLLRESALFRQVEPSGDIRRYSETIPGIQIIASAYDIPAAMKGVEDRLETERKEGSRIFIKNESGVDISLELCLPDAFPQKLHETTGSGDYIKEFYNYINTKNIDLTGIETEKEIYERAGIPYLPPELREGKSALDRALTNGIPELIEEKDLHGMIHLHSTWSDGKNSIKEMALACRDLGFEYMVLTDHSRSSAIANGLDIEKLKQQHSEIDKLNGEDLGIRIIKGIESDILSDGSLDYPDEILESIDIIIASVHNGFKMSMGAMTKRIINALKNPYTTILGHPTGRLLLSRPPYEVDIKQVIDAAADYGKVIEINSNPYRLDLSWENSLYAKEKGVKLALSPDSHRSDTLDDIFLGVKVARKAWLTNNDIINCLRYEDFMKNFAGK